MIIPSRFQTTDLLALLFALAACTRSERATPAATKDRPTATTSAAPTTTVPTTVPTTTASTEMAAPMPDATNTTLGFDSLVTQKRTESTCYASARYVVVERDLEEQVGADLYVRPRGVPGSAPRCDADSLAGDIVFRTGAAASHHPEWQHFLGLKGDLLMAWDGTGAAEDLYIYDLNKRAKALVIADADDRLEWPAPMTPAVWVTTASGEHAAKAGCPDTLPANPPQLDSLMSLDLATLVLRPTGRYRCTVGQ